MLYSHNLGSFDAYFIYKPLVKYFKGKSNNKLNPISAFIDDRNKFIMINAQYSHNTLEGKHEGLGHDTDKEGSGGGMEIVAMVRLVGTYRMGLRGTAVRMKCHRELWGGG